MGRMVLVACTNVGRYIIEEFMNNTDIGAELAGVVNLNLQQGMNKANYDSYSDLAEKYGLHIHYCNNINDSETIEFIEACEPDVILQSGWSQKFNEKVLSIPKYGCIGEHPAPLPKGRGAACVNWAIINGETEWGDSYFKMVSEYDKGDLYAQKQFRIEQYDTAYTIYEKVAKCAVEVVSDYAAKWTQGEFDVISQDESKVTYYKKRRPSDGEIFDFNKNAVVLHNFIRAQTSPYPGAFVTASGGKLYLLDSAVPDNVISEHNPGTVIGITGNGGLLVTAGDYTVIEIRRVRFENAPSQWASELVETERLPVNLFDII